MFTTTLEKYQVLFLIMFTTDIMGILVISKGKILVFI